MNLQTASNALKYPPGVVWPLVLVEVGLIVGVSLVSMLVR